MSQIKCYDLVFLMKLFIVNIICLVMLFYNLLLHLIIGCSEAIQFDLVGLIAILY